MRAFERSPVPAGRPRGIAAAVVAGCAVGAALAALMMFAAGCGRSSKSGIAGAAEADATWRSREAYAAERATRRLYEGAPPVIPHPVVEWGREDCLMCHLEGGAFDADDGRPAPVTPHPERVNCRQCHVEQVVNAEWRPNRFEGLGRRRPAERLNPLGPPYIPHRIQDREDCAKCHLGDSVPDVIKPAHGNRPNCTQCHVQLEEATSAFPPGRAEGGSDAGAR